MKNKITPQNITKLKKNEIMVFGSNMNGNHAAGAAKTALDKFYAVMGQAQGIQGKAYALPTLDENMQQLPLERIKVGVQLLASACNQYPDKVFLITEVGCGIAGFKPEQIAPLFKDFLDIPNCTLPQSFVDILTAKKVIRTYKVTDANMKCKGYQFELGKRFEHEGMIKICNYGFHSCLKPSDCFKYYEWADKTLRMFVCEIEIQGNEQFEGGDNIEAFEKICSNNITLIEEVTDKILVLCNSGDSNSGYSNSGYSNSGYSNSGYSNSGDWNSGDSNSGDSNSGNSNSGDRNSGDSNSGDSNSGDRNSGYSNSGDRNSGYRNSGDWNSGDFNTNTPKLRIFNKETSKKRSDIYFPNWIYFDLCSWVNYNDLTENQQKDITYAKDLDGALITKSYKQAWVDSFNKCQSDEERKSIFDLPNFDTGFFLEIAGIDLRKFTRKTLTKEFVATVVEYIDPRS